MVKIIPDPLYLPANGNTSKKAIRVILETIDDFRRYLQTFAEFECEFTLMKISDDSEQTFPTIILDFPQTDTLTQYPTLIPLCTGVYQGEPPDFLYIFLDFPTLNQLLDKLVEEEQHKGNQTQLWKYCCCINSLQTPPELEEV